MQQSMPIGIYAGTGATASDRIDAALDAARAEHEVFANQSLEAIPVSRASRETVDDADDNREARLEEIDYQRECLATAHNKGA
jgi:hypothetical protein